MITQIGVVTLHVSDQEQALRFYVETLGFEKRMDMPFGQSRWLTVAPPGENTEIVLADKFAEASGSQVGGASGFVLYTDVMDATYADLEAKGVKFTMVPTPQPWGGLMAQFEDPDGNEHVLVQMPTA